VIAVPATEPTVAREGTAALDLRPQRDADLEFLCRLYASTREGELRQVDWTEDQKAAFLRSQFEAQWSHYRTHYEDASFQVIERAGVPVGRFYLRRGPTDIRIVDLAQLPEARGRGIGTGLLTAVLNEAAAGGRSVSIHVEMFNPALRLYERLGFVQIGVNGVYYLMEWKPADAVR
jgi:ribosomal protein S18 acetylase RimI-like enzyme